MGGPQYFIVSPSSPNWVFELIGWDLIWVGLGPMGFSDLGFGARASQFSNITKVSNVKKNRHSRYFHSPIYPLLYF